MVTKEMSQLAVQYCLNVAAANGLDEMLQRVLLLVEGVDLDWTHPITGDTALLTGKRKQQQQHVTLPFRTSNSNISGQVWPEVYCIAVVQ